MALGMGEPKEKVRAMFLEVSPKGDWPGKGEEDGKRDWEGENMS